MVWLPLVEVSQKFGALEVLPGSHRRGLLKTRPDPFGNVVDESQLEKMNLFPLPLSRAMPLFSMFTVPKTEKEQRPGIRWAVTRYNGRRVGFVEHRAQIPLSITHKTHCSSRDTRHARYPPGFRSGIAAWQPIFRAKSTKSVATTSQS